MENSILIEKLIQEQEVLINRLKSIRSAIVGLGGEVSNELLQDFLPLTAHENKKELSVPAKYELGLPKVQKISYAIDQLHGEAFASEIIGFIIQKEEELKNENVFGESFSSAEKELFKRKITLLISYLHKRGSLKSSAVKGKYKYRINKKST